MSDEVMIVDQPDAEEIVLSDYESMGMTPADMKAFFQWAMGDSSEPPDVVQKMMVNLSAKLSMGLGINIVGNIGRQTRLTRFLEKMEEEIYDVGRIAEMSDKEKMSAYKEARSTLNALQEFQRKFIVQNKEFRPEGGEQEKLLSRIMALPKDKLARIVAVLDEDSQPIQVAASDDPEELFPSDLSEEV